MPLQCWTCSFPFPCLSLSLTITRDSLASRAWPCRTPAWARGLGRRGSVSLLALPARAASPWDLGAAVAAPCLVWTQAVIVCSCSLCFLTYLAWVAQRYSCSTVGPQRHPRFFLAPWCSLVFQYSLAAGSKPGQLGPPLANPACCCWQHR